MGNAFTLLSWNVQRPGRGRIAGVIDAITSRRPDVVTLQEANDRVASRLAESGYPHQVYGRHKSYPPGRRDHMPKHAALVASSWPLTPDIGWTAAACYPSLFARAMLETPIGPVDVVTAHIPNGSSNGWRKVQHCQLLGRVLREAAPRSRILTGDFNEPREFLADGRVVSFAAELRANGELGLDGTVSKGIEDIEGPHTWREWDRAVCDLFSASFHGLSHVIERAGGTLHPMPVTHQTRAANRFFDHAFVSRELGVRVEYLHELRGPNGSDHSALMLSVSRRSVPDTPAWHA